MKPLKLTYTLGATLPNPSSQFGNMKPEFGIEVEIEPGDDLGQVRDRMRSFIMNALQGATQDCDTVMRQTATARPTVDPGQINPPLPPRQPVVTPQQVAPQYAAPTNPGWTPPPQVARMPVKTASVSDIPAPNKPVDLSGSFGQVVDQLAQQPTDMGQEGAWGDLYTPVA